MKVSQLIKSLEVLAENGFADYEVELETKKGKRYTMEPDGVYYAVNPDPLTHKATFLNCLQKVVTK